MWGVILKYIHKFFHISPFRGKSLVPLPLSVGYTDWLTSNKQYMAE